MAPDGGTDKFADGEILWFTVKNLDTGNSLNLSSYTILGNLPKNTDFLYEHTSGTNGIQRVDTTIATTDIDVTLSNGDRFGFASWLGNLKENGNVGEITFRVISEPPAGYDAFATLYDLQEGAEGDDDKDNVSNLAEYAINGNPTNAADTGQTGISNDGSTFTYVHAKHATDNSLVYRLIDTTDLVNGTPGTNGYVSQVDGPVVGDYLTVTNNYDMTGKPVQFVELEVEQ